MLVSPDVSPTRNGYFSCFPEFAQSLEPGVPGDCKVYVIQFRKAATKVGKGMVEKIWERVEIAPNDLPLSPPNPRQSTLAGPWKGTSELIRLRRTALRI